MSRESGHDQLVNSIDQELSNFSTTMTRPFICRVSDELRIRNEKAYNPVIIAIGPFHCDKHYLMNMEDQKKRYLKLLLESKGEQSVDKYVNAMRDLEQRARKCYAESITLGEDEFVKMLLLDGIFIIEFLRKYPGYIFDEGREDDPIFQVECNLSLAYRDLLVFENQIPLFVLEELFKLLEIHDPKEISNLIRPLTFEDEMPKEISLCEAEHLLGLVHYASCHSFAQKHHRGRLDEENTINSAARVERSMY